MRNYYTLINSMGSGAAAPSYLLDTYTGSVGAFSVFKERTAYTGSCIRVRRSSDNTESNIGFISNYIDVATLLAFVGAGDGFVTTFYDQTINGRNLTQTTATFQPKIVTSGVLNTSGGKATIVFDGTNDYLRNDALGALYTGGNNKLITAYGVFEFTASTYQLPFSFNLSTTVTGLEVWWPVYKNTADYRSYKRDDSGTSKTATGGTATLTQQLLSLNSSGTAISVYKNGTAIITNGDINVSSTSLDNLAIGASVRNTVGDFSAIKMQQLFLWDTNESANIGAVNTLIKTRFGL